MPPTPHPTTEDALGKVFQVDLMNDANARRNDAKGFKGLLAPFQEPVSLAIPLEFHFEIQAQRVGRTKEIHLNGMIHHKIHRNQWLDNLWVLFQLCHRGAHSGQIHQKRHASEVLEHNACDHEGNFLWSGRLGIPCSQRGDVALGDLFSVAIAEHRFEHDSDTDGQSGDPAESFFLQGRQGVVKAGFSMTGIESAEGISHRQLVTKKPVSAPAIC
jgi:hypothetical protein